MVLYNLYFLNSTEFTQWDLQLRLSQNIAIPWYPQIIDFCLGLAIIIQKRGSPISGNLGRRFRAHL